jgi:hypothetical protein
LPADPKVVRTDRLSLNKERERTTVRTPTEKLREDLDSGFRRNDVRKPYFDKGRRKARSFTSFRMTASALRLVCLGGLLVINWGKF